MTDFGAASQRRGLIETIWIRGYRRGMKTGYTKIRDLRIIAMAYEWGYLSARRKRGKETLLGK